MNKIFFETKQLFILILRIFFSSLENGTRCIVCNKRTMCTPVCTKCQNSYFNIKKSMTIIRCEVCGKELISNHNICSSCKENKVLNNIDKMLPLFSYRLWNKELLYLWKIKGERVLSPLFASFFMQALCSLEISVVVPVPPRKGKIEKNGWDQIDEVCSFLQYRYDFKILKILERKSTKQQKKLNREERIDTINDAYQVIDSDLLKKQLKKSRLSIPEKIVLIDDVCTTGATLECCAKKLKEIGIREVFAVTLFTVD